jgi:predicted Zn-dependent peptidase
MAAIPIQHWTQPSGAKVYLVESPSIPMVDVQMDFDAGSRRDPADKAGLARVTAGMTSKGITAARTPGSGPYDAALDENQLSEAWADLGAAFSASAGTDRMSFSLRSLNYPDLLAKAVELAARQLADPSFPDHVWQRERQRLSASIREANTKPATIAGHAYAAAVYGSHPYGYETKEETLARISVEDMQQAYRRQVEPCRAKVSIVGAVTRAQADAMVTTLLSRLPSHRPVRAARAGGRGRGPFGPCRARDSLRVRPGPCPDGPARLQAQRPRPFRAAGGQLHAGRRGLRVTADRRGAGKKGPELQRLQLLRAGAACRRVHGRPPDPP